MLTVTCFPLVSCVDKILWFLFQVLPDLDVNEEKDSSDATSPASSIVVVSAEDVKDAPGSPVSSPKPPAECITPTDTAAAPETGEPFLILYCSFCLSCFVCFQQTYT